MTAGRQKGRHFNLRLTLAEYYGMKQGNSKPGVRPEGKVLSVMNIAIIIIIAEKLKLP